MKNLLYNLGVFLAVIIMTTAFVITAIIDGIIWIEELGIKIINYILKKRNKKKPVC